MTTPALTALGFTRPPAGPEWFSSGSVPAMPPLATPPLAAALDALAKGYGCVPVRPGSKSPAVPWKRYQGTPPTAAELAALFADARRNVALLTTGLVVFDCDDPAMAERVLAESGDTPYRVRTPRGGVHLGYRARRGVPLSNRVDVKGLKIDVRTTGGLVLLPPSRTDRGVYAWLGNGLPPRHELPVARVGWTMPFAWSLSIPYRARHELPVARVGWTRERQRRAVAAVFDVDPSDAVRRARAYLAKVGPAVSGQRGHDTCFRAACVLAVKFRLTYAQAWPLLVEWNRNNLPPFTERELEHKLRDAVAKAGGAGVSPTGGVSPGVPRSDGGFPTW
jgi:hypothetical protein